MAGYTIPLQLHVLILAILATNMAQKFAKINACTSEFYKFSGHN